MAPDEKTCKSIYVNILDGYTPFVHEGQNLYFKHFDIRDQVFLDTRYDRFFEELKEEGAQTESDILALCDKQGVWTSEHEQQIENKQNSLKHLRLTEEKLVIDRDKKEVRAKIDSKEKELRGLLIEKQGLVAKSCENLASSLAADCLFPRLFYYDAALQNAVFSEEEYEDLHDDEIQDFLRDYNEATIYLNNGVIKHVGLKTWFLNPFLFSGEQPHTFLCKPLCNYTVFQESLISYGVTYKNIFSSHQNIPKEVQDDPDKLLSWHRSQSKDNKPEENYHGKSDIEALKASGQGKLKKKDVYRGRGLNVR